MLFFTAPKIQNKKQATICKENINMIITKQQ